MKAAGGFKRLLALSFALFCLAVVGWALVQANARLMQARSAALSDAGAEIARTAAPRIEQRRIPDQLMVDVERLLGEAGLGLNYVTLSNADNVTLVSRGRLGETLSWLPAAQARQWRGWLYRVSSAENSRPLLRESQRVGQARFGVSWLHVLTDAGTPLLIWATAVIVAAAGLFMSLARARSGTSGVPVQASVAAAGTTGHRGDSAATVKAAEPRPVAARKERRARRKDDEFAPIEPATASRGAVPAAAPGVQPAQDAPPPVQLATNETDKPDATAPQMATDVESPAAAPAELDPRPPASPLPARTDVAGAGREFHAPRVDVEPQLGDETLDLRFYPVWQGSERRALAGAWAALAWRSGEAELVDAATLTRLAERDGALRAFTQWIARRFSLLHGNWRTLELDTVPILLPIPSAMLAFSDAEAVWRDALRRTDRDPSDLVLRLSERASEQPHTALPVRRALAIDRPDADIPADCDVLCVQPTAIDGHIDAWQECFDAARRPVLLGPIADTAGWAELIEHERVYWFSDSPDNLHSPRSFARLLARHHSEPI